jgi:ankyrin repeat protein
MWRILLLSAVSHVLGSPLIDATERGNYEEVERLLAANADPNEAAMSSDGSPTTALISAAQRRRYAVIRVLLAGGATVDLRDQHGRSALMHAAASGLMESVTLLLNAGASLTAVDQQGEGALARAAERGHFEVARALLSQGADPNRISHGCVGPLQLAIAGCHSGIVKLLHAAGAFTDVVPTQPPTTMAAVAVGHAPPLAPGQRKCRAGAMPELSEQPGAPDECLHLPKLLDVPLSSFPKPATLVEWQEAAGADAEPTEAMKKGMRTAAVMHGELLPAFFTKHSKPPEGTDYSRWNMLHFAATHGDVDTTRTLLAMGASVDARETSAGATALHLSCRGGHAENVQVLLEGGASPQTLTW